MRKLDLPGFPETPLKSRFVSPAEALQEFFCIEGCDAQVFFLSYPPRHAAAEHTHGEFRVTLVRSGRMRFEMGGQSRTVAAGEIIVIRPDEKHGFEGIGEEPIRIAEFVFHAAENGPKEVG